MLTLVENFPRETLDKVNPSPRINLKRYIKKLITFINETMRNATQRNIITANTKTTKFGRA